jgi:hypothetical protein
MLCDNRHGFFWLPTTRSGMERAKPALGRNPHLLLLKTLMAIEMPMILSQPNR